MGLAYPLESKKAHPHRPRPFPSRKTEDLEAILEILDQKVWSKPQKSQVYTPSEPKASAMSLAALWPVFDRMRKSQFRDQRSWAPRDQDLTHIIRLHESEIEHQAAFKSQRATQALRPLIS